TELVIEDLEREIAVIAGIDDGGGELDDGEIALARHVAEVAAPVKQGHVDLRRIGQLHDEDPLPRNRADRIDVDPFREAMKAVEDKADIRMVGPPYDLPRIAMVADMLAPGQGFVADAKATPPRPFTKLPEIVSGAIHATEREGRHI